MRGSLKEQLAQELGIGLKIENPRCEIQRVFNDYKQRMSGKIIKTHLEDVHLCDENFPYWIKLERLNGSTGEWEEAEQGDVIPQLQAGTFSGEGYQMAEDGRRAKTLAYLPNILMAPHAIHKKKPESKIRGDHAYVQKWGRKYTAVFTIFCRRTQKSVVVTLFNNASNAWMQKNLEHPPLSPKTKATD